VSRTLGYLNGGITTQSEDSLCGVRSVFLSNSITPWVTECFDWIDLRWDRDRVLGFNEANSVMEDEVLMKFRFE